MPPPAEAGILETALLSDGPRLLLSAVHRLNGGAIATVFYGQRYLDWQQQQIGLYMAVFSLVGSLFILTIQPLLSRVLRRKVTDLEMARLAYIGPVAYFALLATLPNPSVMAFALLPLFSLATTALPHFRALFSKAQSDAAQGEQMSLVAALESLPQLYAAPLAALAFNKLLHHPQLVLLGAAALPLAAMVLLWVGLPSSYDGRGGATADGPSLLPEDRLAPINETDADSTRVPVE